METKYKLRVSKTVLLSARKSYAVTTVFVWTDKADALACKALLEKAANKDARIEFVEFTEEKPLTE